MNRSKPPAGYIPTEQEATVDAAAARVAAGRAEALLAETLAWSTTVLGGTPRPVETIALPETPPAKSQQPACAAGCGPLVTMSDWAVHDPATGRWWHAWCWHVTEAPGQGDLLDLLTVQP